MLIKTEEEEETLKKYEEEALKKIDFAIDKNDYLYICNVERLCVTSLNRLKDSDNQVKAISNVDLKSSLVFGFEDETSTGELRF